MRSFCRPLYLLQNQIKLKVINKTLILSKIVLLIGAFLLLNNIQSQNIPNGGFEQWTENRSGVSEPFYWETQNEPGLNFVERTDGYSGKYAVKLKVIWDEVIKSFTGGSINTVENFVVDTAIRHIKLFLSGQHEWE